MGYPGQVLAYILRVQKKSFRCELLSRRYRRNAGGKHEAHFVAHWWADAHKEASAGSAGRWQEPGGACQQEPGPERTVMLQLKALETWPCLQKSSQELLRSSLAVARFRFSISSTGFLLDSIPEPSWLCEGRWTCCRNHDKTKEGQKNNPARKRLFQNLSIELSR